jgi:hypothetical protein
MWPQHQLSWGSPRKTVKMKLTRQAGCPAKESSFSFRVYLGSTGNSKNAL